MPKGIPRNQTTQRKIIHRLKIVRGHLDKVISMVQDEAYCLDVVHQSIAVQAALKKIDEQILQNHLESCVVKSFKNGKEKETIGEIMEVVRKV